MSRPLVFAIINVTPDSFSDGGRYLDPGAAVARGLRAAEEGADVLDVGGESTRPSGHTYGAGPREVSVAEELVRVIPVIRGLRETTSRPISIDTRKAAVARAALEEGVSWVNDVSGGSFDPMLLSAVAGAGARLILMHMRGTPETMATLTQYRDLVSEVKEELLQRVEAARAAGVAGAKIWIDPGLGFAKTPEQSRRLLGALEGLTALGHPVLVGASHKSLLGSARPPEERVSESLAAAILAVQGGAAGLRVHDVGETVRALGFLELVRSAGIAAAPGAASG